MGNVGFQAVEHSLVARLRELAAEGSAVGIAVGGRSSFGFAGSVAGSPVDAGTVFYAASVTKQMIGLLFAGSVCAGHADLDDTLVEWIPELPAWMRTDRLRHLAHHLSDLPDLTDPALGPVRASGGLTAGP